MEKIKIKFICNSIGSGGTPDSSNSSYYCDEGGFNWMTIKDMDDERIIRTKMQITKAGLASKNLKVYKKGTLLYSIYATLGRTMLLPFDSTVNQAILAFAPNKKKVTMEFLRYSLDSKENEILKDASTSTQANLSLGKVKNFYIPSISIKEQDVISSFLTNKTEKIDELISNLENQITELRNYKQSFIEETIHKNKMLKKVKFSVFVRTKKCDHEGEPNFALENIESDTGSFVETSSEYSSSGATICKAGDVCFGKLRPYLNKYYLVKENGTCSSEIAVFKEYQKTKYMYYLVQSPRFLQYSIAYSEGTKMPRINIEKIKNWKFDFPDFDEQRKIVSTIEEKIGQIEKLIETKKEKIESLRLYKKSLIFEYVNGIREVSA